MTRTRLTLSLLALAAPVVAIGCIQREAPLPTPVPPRAAPVLSSAGAEDQGAYQINRSVTVGGIGSARGIFGEGNFIYIMGSLSADGSGPGVVREFFMSTDDDGGQTLRPSGRQIVLTESGSDIAPHPTGLTWHPNFGYWLGSTVDQRGTLFQIDFRRALRQGNLDGCVLHEVDDDAAINGTRPMFLTLPGGRVTLATSDYGDQSNTLRLYDPLALLAADRTSTTGVIFSEAPCGPFVQSLASRGEAGEPGELWLVQNQTEGVGFRLTEIMLDASGSIDAQRVLDFDRPTSELEGLLWMEPNRNDEIPFIMVSAQREQNVHLGRRMPPKRFVNPIQRQLNR
ncbi:MAG: hypothetical protein AAFS11_01640 [Planctomycetota bacterium]